MKRVRTFITSCLIIFFSVVLAVVGTFALFSDTVNNNDNKIQAGTLSVGLLLTEKSDDAFNATSGKVEAVKEENLDIDLKTSTDPVFALKNLAPTYTGYRKFKVINNGTLPFNYSVKIVDKTNATVTANITDFITFKIDGTAITLGEFTLLDLLKAENDEATFNISYEISENAGNSYQGLEFQFDIVLYATQIVK